jgi:hypothetical protein
MKVEIGTEAAQFPEKECKNGIFVAVQPDPIGGHKTASNLVCCTHF